MVKIILCRRSEALAQPINFRKQQILDSYLFIFLTTQLQCGVLDGDVIDLSSVNVELDNPGSIANPWRLFPADEQLSEFHCQIVIEYIPDGSIQDGRVFTVASKHFIMSKKSTPSAGGHIGTSSGKSKGTKTMMWAIPVALVVLALFAGLGVMVYKYRRLQHSFLAFAARGNYTRQEDDLEDDDNMVVGFHAGKFLNI